MITVHRCYGMMKVYKIRKENRMEQTIKFTKKNTLAVKGIAISFLLCYHCFSQTARMGGAKVSFWPLPQNLAMLISLCMVHCVGMFAFLSVYGLTLSMKSKYPEYDFDGHTATLFKKICKACINVFSSICILCGRDFCYRYLPLSGRNVC